jgi:hypothetical protein
MYLHAALLKITASGYTSYDEIYWQLRSIGYEGNANTSGREVRVLVARKLIDWIDYPNKNNGGTHRRFRKARRKKTRIEK